MDTYVPSIPPALSERLIWRDGSFHASEELKGDTLLDALFARCSREMDVAVVPCRWYSPRAFEKNFGVHFMNKEGSINATVDAIVDLLRKAWTLRRIGYSHHLLGAVHHYRTPASGTAATVSDFKRH